MCIDREQIVFPIYIYVYAHYKTIIQKKQKKKYITWRKRKLCTVDPKAFSFHSNAFWKLFIFPHPVVLFAVNTSKWINTVSRSFPKAAPVVSCKMNAIPYFWATAGHRSCGDDFSSMYYFDYSGESIIYGLPLSFRVTFLKTKKKFGCTNLTIL